MEVDRARQPEHTHCSQWQHLGVLETLLETWGRLHGCCVPQEGAERQAMSTQPRTQYSKQGSNICFLLALNVVLNHPSKRFIDLNLRFHLLARYPSHLLMKWFNCQLPHKICLKIWKYTTAFRLEQRWLSIKAYKTTVSSMHVAQLWHFQVILKAYLESKMCHIPLAAENFKKWNNSELYEVIFCLYNSRAKPKRLLKSFPTAKSPSKTQHLHWHATHP